MQNSSTPSKGDLQANGSLVTIQSYTALCRLHHGREYRPGDEYDGASFAGKSAGRETIDQVHNSVSSHNGFRSVAFDIN